MRSNIILERCAIRANKRVRFEGDTEPPYYQIDLYLDNGTDHHAAGKTLGEALIRLGERCEALANANESS